MKKLPKTMYLFRDNEGTKDEYFASAESLDELSDKGESRIVGEYVLKRVLRLTTCTVATPVTE